MYVYCDNCEGIYSNLIHEFYDVEEVPLQCNRKSGAGNLMNKESRDDKSDEDNNKMPDDYIIDFVNHQQEKHVHYEVVHVSTVKSPFINGDEACFFTMLHKVVSQKILVSGFKLMLAKWELDHYLTFKSIHVG